MALILPALPQPPRAAEGTAPGPFDPAMTRLGCVTRSFTAEQLFAGTREIEIIHGDSRYRLRHTSTGKLILTK